MIALFGNSTCPLRESLIPLARYHPTYMSFSSSSSKNLNRYHAISLLSSSNPLLLWYSISVFQQAQSSIVSMNHNNVFPDAMMPSQDNRACATPIQKPSSVLDLGADLAPPPYHETDSYPKTRSPQPWELIRSLQSKPGYSLIGLWRRPGVGGNPNSTEFAWSRNGNEPELLFVCRGILNNSKLWYPCEWEPAEVHKFAQRAVEKWFQHTSMMECSCRPDYLYCKKMGKILDDKMVSRMCAHDRACECLCFGVKRMKKQSSK